MKARVEADPLRAGTVESSRKFRVLGLAAFGLLLSAAAGLYLYLTYSHPIGSGPAGPPVDRRAFGRPWTQQKVLLVGFGDSVTAGFGARPGYSYFDRLRANPSDESEEMRGVNLASVFPSIQSTNLAVSGSVSLAVLTDQMPRLPRAPADTMGWVVITTGGNDLIHNYGKTPPREHALYGATWQQAEPWITNFRTRLERIVAGIAEKFPGGCHVFLANIYDPTDGEGDIEKTGLPAWPDGTRILAAYNNAIERCATTHTNVHLVNIHDAFLGHGIHCRQFWGRHYDTADPYYWYYFNLEDPNERGYDAIRRVFLREMTRVSTERSQSAP